MQSPIRIELPTIFHMGSVNAYLFTHPEVILVDCGEKTDANWDALQAGLAKEGLSISDIDKVFITHAHVDHMGMAAKVAEEADAQVLVSDYCWIWATELKELWPQRIGFMSDLVLQYGVPKSELEIASKLFSNVNSYWDQIPKDRLVNYQVGEKFNFGGGDWEVIYLPGHSNTQCGLYDHSTKGFLSADMLLAKAPVPVLEFKLGTYKAGTMVREKSLQQMLDCFAMVRSLDIETVFPGHWEIFGEHKKVIDKQVARIHQRKEECFTLIGQGFDDIYKLVEKMYPYFPMEFRMPAYGMLFGYLDLLETAGKIKLIKTAERFFYKQGL